MKKEILFNAATVAFSQNHPKFPWPKKNGLEEQSDEFKLAFNALHEALEYELKEAKDEMYENLLTRAEESKKDCIKENKTLKKKLKAVARRAFIVNILLALIVGFIFFSVTQADCIPGPMSPNPGSSIESCL